MRTEFRIEFVDDDYPTLKFKCDNVQPGRAREFEAIWLPRIGEKVGFRPILIEVNGEMVAAPGGEMYLDEVVDVRHYFYEVPVGGHDIGNTWLQEIHVLCSSRP